MKVLLRKRIRRLGTIGDIVDVKPGYARNYLIPQGLGVLPTKAGMRRIENEKVRYLSELAQEREDLEARIKILANKEVTIVARANDLGHLYGSVGPAQIAHAMAELDLPVSPDEIILLEPITQLDRYEVTIELDDDIKTTIQVWIIPSRGAVLEDHTEDPTLVSDDPAETVQASETLEEITEEPVVDDATPSS